MNPTSNIRFCNLWTSHFRYIFSSRRVVILLNKKQHYNTVFSCEVAAQQVHFCNFCFKTWFLPAVWSLFSPCTLQEYAMDTLQMGLVNVNTLNLLTDRQILYLLIVSPVLDLGDNLVCFFKLTPVWDLILDPNMKIFLIWA